MESRCCSLVSFTLLVALVQQAHGHGFLAYPGSRNSMWRLGFNTPTNYNDMGLNCGGAANQWQNNGGRCGLCGDPYESPKPREHEAGSYMAPVTRPISMCYSTQETVISVGVKITAHHQGYFEFRLCENNNMYADPDQSCVDNGHLLRVAGTGETRYYITGGSPGMYEYALEIPSGVTCTQCILHWKYNTGNSYGCDETGCDIGKGPQEQFINCADIAILPDCEDMPTTISMTAGTTTPWTTQTTQPPQTTTQGPFTTDDGMNTGDLDCKATGPWTGDAAVDDWCMMSCNHPQPNCPATHCICDD